MVRGGVVDEFPEVGPDGGLAAADVDVENLHAFKLIDDVHALPGGQLARVALARRGKAVHAGQVAGVGQLPRETDGSVQAAFELFDETGCCSHRISSPMSWHTNMFDVASTPSACRYGACRAGSMPAAESAERASG